MARQAIETIYRTCLIALIGSLLLGGGCRQKPPRVYKVAYTSPNSAQRLHDPTTGQGADSAYPTPNNQPVGQFLVKTAPAGAEPSGEYHLGVGDELKITVSQLVEMNRDHIEATCVDPQGQIYLPILQRVQATGLTADQLQKQLVQRLAQEYIQDPQVDVKITLYRSKEVIVLGEVRQPGSIFLKTDNATLLDVVSLAGGIVTGAAPNIEILRGTYSGSSGGSVQPVNLPSTVESGYVNRELVPVRFLFAEEGPQINPIIYPGDMVKVGSATEGYIYVDGEVKQPGAKSFRRPFNILQAINTAGGMTKIAEDRRCDVIRRLSSGNEQIIKVDLEKIRSGEHQNLEIAQNDVIIISVNKNKKFWADFASLFRTGVYAGVDARYNAATGEPTGGGF